MGCPLTRCCTTLYNKSMDEILKDLGGRRKAPRLSAHMGPPKANIRANYRLGYSIIKQLESLAQLIAQQQRDWVGIKHRKILNPETKARLEEEEEIRFEGRRPRWITTSDVARNLIKLGFDRLYELAEEKGKPPYEVLYEEIRWEEDDEKEHELGLNYTSGSKWGAVGSIIQAPVDSRFIQEDIKG